MLLLLLFFCFCFLLFFTLLQSVVDVEMSGVIRERYWDVLERYGIFNILTFACRNS